MIFGCDAVARSHASISALKLLSLHMCGGAALWRCKTVGWCLTGCGRACCDTGSAAHSHPVTVDKPMHKSVLVHPAILPTIVGGTALMRARRLLWGDMRVRSARSKSSRQCSLSYLLTYLLMIR